MKNYALCLDDCDVKQINEGDEITIILESMTNTKRNRRDSTISYGLKKGQMVEIIDYIAQHNHINKFCIIKILDYALNNVSWQQQNYLCKIGSLLEISSDVWPYVIAIIDPWDRLAFAKDKSYGNYIKNLTLNDLVELKSEHFQASLMQESLTFGHNPPKFFDCVVKYIGPIPEISASGYCFGLQLVVIFPSY